MMELKEFRVCVFVCGRRQCEFVTKGKWKNETLERALLHIRRVHPKLLPKIEKLAKSMAFDSQFGRGYGGDWLKAQKTFREAWREHALERLILEKKL